MLFTIGTHIRFKHTGEEGIIVEILELDMLNVQLPDGEVIPAFAQDIIRIEDEIRPRHKPPVKAKSITTRPPTPPNEPPKRQPPESQYNVLKGMGIQVAFEEIKSEQDQSILYFHIHLINDTLYDILYTFALYHSQHSPTTLQGKLEKHSAIHLYEMPFTWLNHHPIIHLECWQITTRGSGKKLSKKIKIKPQQFFKKRRTAPILDKEVYHYIAFKNFDPPTAAEKKQPQEDLRSYTKRNIKKHQVHSPLDNLAAYPLHKTKAFAEFETELDLHIEKLTQSPDSLSNADILQLQMKRFETFMHQAIRLGVPKVFIIHGIGTGRLKKEVSRWLEENPYVISFKNEYHHKYGWGATEVEL